MEYKHLTEVPEEIRQAYIRERAERKVMNKINNKLKIIKELKLSC